MKPSELLNEARDELFQGWTKGTFVTSEGSVCAVGALERCAMRSMAFQQAGEAQKALNSKAMEIYGYGNVMSVNDRHDITKQDVLDLFDKASIGLQEVGN